MIDCGNGSIRAGFRPHDGTIWIADRTRILSARQVTPALAHLGNESNRLSLQCRAGRAVLSINGTEVARAVMAGHEPGAFGIGGGLRLSSEDDTVDVRFDNLVLTQEER